MLQSLMDVVDHKLLKFGWILLINDELRVVLTAVTWWRSPDHGVTSHCHSIILCEIGKVITVTVIEIVVALGNMNRLACVLARQQVVFLRTKTSICFIILHLSLIHGSTDINTGALGGLTESQVTFKIII